MREHNNTRKPAERKCSEDRNSDLGILDDLDLKEVAGGAGWNLARNLRAA
jgi:hypothetical protein